MHPPILESIIEFDTKALATYNHLNYSPQQPAPPPHPDSTVFQGLISGDSRCTHDADKSCQVQVPQLYTGAQVFFTVSEEEPNQCCCYHRLDNYLTSGFIRLFGTNSDNINVTYNLNHNYLWQQNHLGRIWFDLNESFYYALATSIPHPNNAQRVAMKGRKVHATFDIANGVYVVNQHKPGALNELYNFQIGVSIVTAVNLYCFEGQGARNTSIYCDKPDMKNNPQVVKTVASIETFFSQEGSLDESSGEPGFIVKKGQPVQRSLPDGYNDCLGKIAGNCSALFGVTDRLDYDHLNHDPQKVETNTSWSPAPPSWWKSCQ